MAFRVKYNFLFCLGYTLCMRSECTSYSRSLRKQKRENPQQNEGNSWHCPPSCAIASAINTLIKKHARVDGKIGCDERTKMATLHLHELAHTNGRLCSESNMASPREPAPFSIQLTRYPRGTEVIIAEGSDKQPRNNCRGLRQTAEG